MHLDKKMITVLVVCTLIGGILGGLVGGMVGSFGPRHESRGYRTSGYMMGQNSDSYGRGNMMGQGGRQANPMMNTQPVATGTQGN